MLYYYCISIGFKDGFEIDSIDDDWHVVIDDNPVDAMAVLEERHGGVVWTQLEGYDLPDWLYKTVGINGLYALEEYVQHNQIAAIDALIVWMNDHRYSNPEPWAEFEEHYIGEFISDEDFGYHIVRERAEAEGIEIPRWLDDLIDYSQEFDPAVYWQEDGYYFYH